jgi:hypothetical protein
MEHRSGLLRCGALQQFQTQARTRDTKNETPMAFYANEDGTYSWKLYDGDSPIHTPVYSYTDGDSLVILEHTHPLQNCLFSCFIGFPWLVGWESWRR